MNSSLQLALDHVVQEAGGEEGVHRILTAFYRKMQSDVMVVFFFVGKDLSHIVSQQQSFFLRAAGKLSTYNGLSPARAHQKLPPILKGHFDRRLVLLRETLGEFGLTPASITAWVSFEERFRKVIVEDES